MPVQQEFTVTLTQFKSDVSSEQSGQVRPENDTPMCQ
jgi:hypothetical protein